MKVLAIDAGNSRIKWGVYANGIWLRRDSLATAAADRLGELLAAEESVERIIVANVAGAEVRSRIEAALRHFPVVPHWIASVAQQCGVRSSYAEPSQLGVDRWAGLVAAHQRYAGACVVVMAGTTVTIDALSADGTFLGGCIVPGVPLMQEALARSTAQLARREGAFLFFPDNTADAIVSGALNALAGAVDRMARYMTEAGEPEPLIVLSGGAAPMLAPRLSGRLERVDNLVLDGLVCIALRGEAA